MSGKDCALTESSDLLEEFRRGKQNHEMGQGVEGLLDIVVLVLGENVAGFRTEE